LIPSGRIHGLALNLCDREKSGPKLNRQKLSPRQPNR
jgi:hypothetical protein